MADPNDDLLEGEGDLVDGEFDLDGADEDALLADDYEEIKTSSKCQRNTHRNHERHLRNRGEAPEDEDAIDLGVMDEDLGLPEDEKSEAWTKNESKSSDRNQFEYSSKNADSDEEDTGERDRGRFKTERNITVRTRTTSAIPETLDGVVVGMRGSNTRGGRAKGKPQTSYRGRNNQTNPIQRNNFTRPPSNNNMDHHHHHHHHHQQQLLPHQQQLLPHQPQQQQHHMPPPPPHQPVHMHHPIHQPQQQAPPPPLHLQSRPLQPNNIHVNPHFRPRTPIAVPNWQVSAPNNYPPPQPLYPPQQFNNFPSPVQPRPVWNEGPPSYYNEPPNYPAHPNYQDNFYSGPPPPEPVYYNQHTQHHQNMNVPSVPPYQNNNWENTNYYPQNQDIYQNQPPLVEPHHQVNQPFMGPLNHIRPQFQRSGSNFAGKGRMNKLRPNIKRDGHLINNKVPPKLQRLDQQRKVSRNLHQVQTVDNLPEPTATVPEQEVCTQVEGCHPPGPFVEIKDISLNHQEEDEEMKEYRMKIEEQKKLREEILRKKEEKRAEAAQQRQQKEKMGKLENSGVNNPVTKVVPPVLDKPGSKDALSPENQFKTVRVRTKDGKTIIRKLSLAVIQRLKKVQPDGKIIKTVKVPQENLNSKSVGQMEVTAPSSAVGGNALSQTVSKIVAIENLSATTTKKQLLNMAKQVGAVQSVELDSEPGKATVKFETNSSATAFIQKFQRKMVDLSMITLTLVPE